MTKARIAAFTGGREVPSARFRIRQHQARLEAFGLDMQEFFPRLSAYPPASRVFRPLWGIGSLLQRLPGLVASHRADVTILQREFISSVMTLEGLTRRPRILDVDDAIWLNSRGTFAARLARSCDGVICGNSFLAEYFEKANPNVFVVPTAVDTSLYRPKQASSDRPYIGWIGTAANLKYLQAIEPALKTVLDMAPSAKLLVISNCPPTLGLLDPKRVCFEPWSESGEVAALQRMAVGLMPLANTPWERGKCSFKMLQYMACGVPAVAAPVGMNREVLEKGGALSAQNNEDWVEHIHALLRDDRARRELGERARQTVVSHYSSDVVAPALAAIVRQFL